MTGHGDDDRALMNTGEQGVQVGFSELSVFSGCYNVADKLTRRRSNSCSFLLMPIPSIGLCFYSVPLSTTSARISEAKFGWSEISAYF